MKVARKDIIIILFMSFYTLLLYYNSLHYDFIHSLDDDWLIIHNSFIKDFSLRGVYNIFFIDKTDFEYHPITYLSYMLDYKLFGLNPMGYKVHNLILHILCGLMMYVVVLKITQNRFISAFVSFLFLIHPLNIESIVWASCRRQSLSFFYFLLSIRFFITNIEGDNKPFNKYFILSVFLFSLSILSKATSIITPFIFGLVYYSIKHRIDKKITLQFLFSFIIIIFFVYLNVVQSHERNYIKRAFDYSYLDHVVFAGYSYFFYWFKTIIMFPLSVFYPAPSESLQYLPYHYYFFALGAIFIVAIAFFHLKQKQYLHFFALMYYSFSIGPILNVIFYPLQDLPVLVKSRYFYHTSLGILLYIGLILNSLIKDKKVKMIVFTFCVVICTIIFKIQIYNWTDSITLMKNTVKYYPSEEIYYRLAIDQYNIGNKKDAFESIDKADNLGTNIWINNGWYFYSNRALIYFDKGDYTKALSDLELAKSKNPNKKILRDIINSLSLAKKNFTTVKDSVSYNQILNFEI